MLVFVWHRFWNVYCHFAAAHCVQTSSSTLRPEELLLVLGKLNIRNWAEEGGLQMGVERVEVHPDYRPLSADADVALLTLSRDVEFTKSVLTQSSGIFSFLFFVKLVRHLCIEQVGETGLPLDRDVIDRAAERRRASGYGRRLGQERAR